MIYLEAMTGRQLKTRREALGLTQQQLALKFDAALSSVARWEQLADEALPNSGMIDLALKRLEDEWYKKFNEAPEVQPKKGAGKPKP